MSFPAFLRPVFYSLLFLGAAVLRAGAQTIPVAAPFPGFQTNEAIVDGLRDTATDLRDSVAVFRRVFASLGDTVTMYPSENYYYFSFTSAGRSIWGSISLFPDERESGRIGFGYTEKQDKYRRVNDSLAGGWGTFGAMESVDVSRIDRFHYRVTCNGRSVVFRFPAITTTPPPQSMLASDEIFVLRNLDESGIGFLLLYNTTWNRFYWVLDPGQRQTETFSPLTRRIVIGNRTQFAFYVDEKRDRMVLVGVEGYNVLNNNWFDGPFDQLPDNYIQTGEFELQRFIVLAHPGLAGTIDRYGRYADNPGTRVAIAPYLVYFSQRDLLDAYEACVGESSSSSDLLSCLTQQIFIVPDHAFAAVERR